MQVKNTPLTDMAAEPTAQSEMVCTAGKHYTPSINDSHLFSGRLTNNILFQGLFLGCGTSVAAAGPGGAILGYILMGTIITSVMSGLGEMTALLPVNAPMMEFPRRFLDRGVGFAIGWIYWYFPPSHREEVKKGWLTNRGRPSNMQVLLLRHGRRTNGGRGQHDQVPLRRRHDKAGLGVRIED